MTSQRAIRRRRKRRGNALISLLDVLFILLFATLVQARDSALNRPPAADSSDDSQLEPKRAAVRDAGAGMDAGPDDADSGDASTRANADAGTADAVTDARAPDDTDTNPGTDAGIDADANERSQLVQADQDRARRTARLVAGGIRKREVLVLEVSAAGDVVAIEHWNDGRPVSRRPLLRRLVRTVHSPEFAFDLHLEYLGRDRPDYRICAIALSEAEPPRDNLDQVVVVILTAVPLRELDLALREGLASDAGGCWLDTGGLALLLDPDRTDSAVEFGLDPASFAPNGPNIPKQPGMQRGQRGQREPSTPNLPEPRDPRSGFPLDQPWQ